MCIRDSLLTLMSSLLVGLLFQRRSFAWLGSLLAFSLGYLFPFIQQAMHPGLSPTGQAQVLIPGAFAGVVATMIALASLFAGAGAVLGQALGEVLISPLIKLGASVLATKPGHAFVSHPSSVVGPLPSLLIGSFVVSTVVISATGVSSLLTYGPTTNLYRPVQSAFSGAVTSGKGTLTYGTFNSPALGGIQRSYWIYLPPSYATNPGRRYPTMYLLHGSPGGPGDWFQAAYANTTADALIAAGKMQEAILVGADGNGPVYRFSEWANSFDRRQRMEDAIAQDLVHFIDRRYRTVASPDYRAIGGNSMGGFGAVNIALHYPDIFHGVMSLGGYFQAEGVVYGTGPGSDAYRQFNSPSLFLHTVAGKKAAALLTFIIGVGTTDGRYYHDGMAFYQELHSMSMRVHLLRDVGGHSWRLWAKQLAEVLPALFPLPGSGLLH